jgi:hypothetical protein
LVVAQGLNVNSTQITSHFSTSVSLDSASSRHLHNGKEILDVASVPIDHTFYSQPNHSQTPQKSSKSMKSTASLFAIEVRILNF